MSVVPVSNYGTTAFVLTGAKDSIVTVPYNFWYDITRIRVSVGTGAAGTAKLFWYDTSLATEFILNDAGAVAVGIPLDEECDPLHLEDGDILKITGSVANMHAFVSYVIGSNAPTQVRGQNAPGFKLGPGWGKS